MFIHSFSMRKMEMYFVFLLFATLLSVRGEIVEVGEELKNKLLELLINDLFVLKLSNANDSIIKVITENIRTNFRSNFKCQEDYCFIVVKLTMNSSDMSAQDLYNALNAVISKDENVEIAKNIKWTFPNMDFLLIEEKIDNTGIQEFFVAVYFPPKYPDVKFNYTRILDEFGKIKQLPMHNVV